LLESLPVPEDVFEAVQAGTDDALADIESKTDEEIEEYIEEQRQVQGELRQTYPQAAQESLSLTPTTAISESKTQTFIRLARAADIPLDDIQAAIEAAQADGATPDVFLEKLVQHATYSDDMGRLQQFIDANYNGGEEFVSAVAAASELFEAVDEEKRRLRSAAAASLAAASPSIPLSSATHSDGQSVSTSSTPQTESYDISPDPRDLSSTTQTMSDPALRDSILELTQTIKDTDKMRRLTRTSLDTRGLPDEQAEAKRLQKEKELQRDPLVQRMLAAGVLSLKDIVKGDSIPLLEDPTTRNAVLERLNTIEQDARDKQQPLTKQYVAEQTMAFQRTIPNTKFKMYVPPRYAPAGTPGAARQRPKTAGAMIGFPTGAYYT
jgi:hypothetical protein